MVGNGWLAHTGLPRSRVAEAGAGIMDHFGLQGLEVRRGKWRYSKGSLHRGADFEVIGPPFGCGGGLLADRRKTAPLQRAGRNGCPTSGVLRRPARARVTSVLAGYT